MFFQSRQSFIQQTINLFGKNFLAVLVLLLSLCMGAAAQAPSSNGFNWFQITPNGTAAPSARYGHRMVYDSYHSKVLLFGGLDGAGTYLNDVWEWDTLASTWTNVTPSSGSQPTPRANFGMAYDAARNKVIIYGGNCNSQCSNVSIIGDTWEWDVPTRTWTQKPAANTIVYVGLMGPQLAYDPTLQKVILFGGQPYWGYPTNGETYSWNGTDWTLITAANPPGQYRHTMITDTVRGKVVLFGGYSYNGTGDFSNSDNVWEWNGTTWSQSTNSNAPGQRRDAALAFDSRRGQTIMFGGENLGDTWEWNGSAWLQNSPLNSPSPRVTSMVYDPVNSVVVLFGGKVQGGVAGETYIYSSLRVSIPTNLTAKKNTTLTVPVNVTDTTGKGIISFDFTLAYDSTIFTPAAIPYSITGTLSNDYTVNVNSSTPGQLRVSGFGTTPLTGAGTLLNLKFNTTGSLHSCNNFSFALFRFNEGSPGSTTSSGAACVVSGNIMGTVTYGTAATVTPVPGVTLTAAGTPNVTATTDAAGTYSIGNLGASAYIVTPSKTATTTGVTAFDASLVSQYAVGLTTLTAAQQSSGDVSGNGEVTSFDAGLIAQSAIGVTNSGTAGNWKFTPVNKSYTAVETDQANQNYTAVLMGDVSGNWAPPSSFAGVVEESDKSLTNAVPVILPNTTATRNRVINLPVTVGDLNGRNIMAYQFDVVFDPAVLEPQSTPIGKEGTLSGGFTVVTNTLSPGRLRVAAFGTQALTGEGDLLDLKFRVIGQVGSNSDLMWQALKFNEGEPSVSGVNGRINIRSQASRNVGVFRPSNGITYMKNANTGGFADISMVYGVAGDQSFAGDWNGDGIDSIGIYRNGVFYLRNSNSTGAADVVFAFGSPGDQPIAGDWNGDGIDTIGIYRPSTGVFMLRNSNTAGEPDVTFVLGNPGDVAIAGDWNGDGITTTGVFRPTNGIVYLKNTNATGNADINLVYGVAGDKPVAGDWDGDGIDSIGIYRDGVFYLRNSNTQGVADLVFALGNPGDEPIAGDWDGLP